MFWRPPETPLPYPLFPYPPLFRPAIQRKVLEDGFRPGNPDVPVGAPVDAAHGVDPDQPQTLLDVPAPPVLAQLLDDWEDQRKPARVLLVMAESGSVRDVAEPATRDTKLEFANAAQVGRANDRTQVHKAQSVCSMQPA